MNIRKVWLIIILMSAALTGIILVQAYWIQNAISLRKTIFNQQVTEVLHRVVDKMERKATADIVKEFNLFEQDLFERVPIDSMAEELLADGALEIEGSDLEEEIELAPTVPALEGPAAAFQPVNPILETRTMVFDVEGQDDAQMMPALLLEMERALMENVAHLDEVLDQMLQEMVHKSTDPNHRVDPFLLDSILNDELQQSGINTPYNFGVLMAEKKLVGIGLDEEGSEEGLLSSPFSVSLNPGNLMTRPDRLFVTFPNSDKYVLRSITSLLAGSFLFTLIIILGFSYAIHIIFRQKQLSDIKTDFINNMTHEFKTPIATISLAVDSMNNPIVLEHPERIQQYTGIIRDENKRMNSQVEKVLQMALLDKNEVKLTSESMDMHSIIGTAMDTIALQIDQANGDIKADLKASRPMVNGDEVHLTNVVRNLLDNAMKYTPSEPRILIETWNDKRGIYISITDNGIGMDRETQKRIFEKFYRVPKGNVHDVKGFGLGLTYVKHILDAHEGSITVKSQLNKGSKFTIYLPT